MMEEVPRGFRYEGRLDGGGHALEGRLALRARYGPVRRLRIRRARRVGDHRRVVALLLRNADAFDLDAWDAPFFEALAPFLLGIAGLGTAEQGSPAGAPRPQGS